MEAESDSALAVSSKYRLDEQQLFFCTRRYERKAELIWQSTHTGETC